MQGRRSNVNSLSNTFEFDHGSSTSNIGANQRDFWHGVLNPVDSLLPDTQRSPSDANNTYVTAVNRDGRSSSGRSFGETSSSEGRRGQIAHEEAKLEERRNESTNTLSLESVNANRSSNLVANGPLFLQNSSTNDIPQNQNLSGSSGSSANGDHVMDSDESDGNRSLDGRRLSCKRKALEGGVSGQLSLGGGPSCSHRPANSVLHAAPARNHASSSSSVSIPTGNPLAVNAPQLNPQLAVGGRGVAFDSHPTLSIAGNAESSQENLYMSINPARQAPPNPARQAPPNPARQAPSTLSSTRNAIRRSHPRSPQLSSPHQSSSTLLPFNNSLDLRPTAANTSSPMSQSHVMHIASLQRNVNPSPWNGASNSRVGSVSGASLIPGERIASQEEVHSRVMPRNISENPMFLQAIDVRNLAQDSTNWNLANGNISIPGNVSSTSRIGSSSGVHQSPDPIWVPHYNPPVQYPRQLSEVVRRSVIIPSTGSVSGGPSSNFPPLRSVPATPQETVPSAQAGHQGHPQPYLRSIWTPREGDGVHGGPLSLRSLAAASDGRSRLLSEIRNVLDFIRRNGDGIRFESVLFGAANLQDRHRDMRLDVDNMTYEELLALEERIGFVSTGLDEESIMKFMKQRKYQSSLIGAPSEVEPCCICQEEYVEGEDVGTLDCGHEFHTGCIKQWLMNKNLCPICKKAGIGK